MMPPVSAPNGPSTARPPPTSAASGYQPQQQYQPHPPQQQQQMQYGQQAFQNGYPPPMQQPGGSAPQKAIVPPVAAGVRPMAAGHAQPHPQTQQQPQQQQPPQPQTGLPQQMAGMHLNGAPSGGTQPQMASVRPMGPPAPPRPMQQQPHPPAPGPSQQPQNAAQHQPQLSSANGPFMQQQQSHAAGPGMPPMPGQMPNSMPPMQRPPAPSGMSMQQQPMGRPPAPGMMMPGMQGPPSMMGAPPAPGGMMGPPPGQPQMQQQHPQAPMMPPGPGTPTGFGGPHAPMPHAPAAPQQRLNANDMPSCLDGRPSQVQVREDDRRARGGIFQTGFPFAEQPPLVTTDFVVEDQGNASPRLMRATLYSTPASNDLLKTSELPFAVCVTPAAVLDPHEVPPPLVDMGALGPVRCQRCKAYMCPFMEFIDGGRRFRCVFCHASSEVPEEYFAHLDHQGRRTDIYQRPELFCGTHDLVATTAYCKNGVHPKEPAYIFMLDVSYNAVRNGMVQLFCSHIKELLADLPRDPDQEKSAMRVGFVTYDQTAHFYNLKGTLDQPQMLVVNDLNDMFVPLVDGFLVTVDEAEAAIDNLLGDIPKMFADTRTTEVILGPVIQAGLDALRAADRAGKLFVMHSSLPLADAPGKLKMRDDRKLLGTDKERPLLTPSGDFYTKLAAECVSNGCAVDLFVFPNQYIDLATIGSLCTTTGGQIYKYQYFEAERDGARLLADLKRNISRPIMFDAIMRVRTCTGIRPTGFYGSMYMSNTTDMELAAIDADKCVTVEMKHDDKIEASAGYIQAAMLYTSAGGRRRLRIMNLCLATTDQHAQLYRTADQDAIVAVFFKQAEQLQRDRPPKDVRDWLSSKAFYSVWDCHLACYRERCSADSNPGQLILPEALKCLPLLANCILKHDSLAGAADMTTDDRSWMISMVAPSRILHLACMLYPSACAVDRLSPQMADGDFSEWPAPVRGSYENFSSERVYLIENGILMFLWFGLGMPKDLCNDLFGCTTAAQVDTEKHVLPEKDTVASRALRRFIEKIHEDRPRRMKLFLIRQGDKLEPWMRKYLVEDRGAGSSASYVDYLCHIHREIRSLLS